MTTETLTPFQSAISIFSQNFAGNIISDAKLTQHYIDIFKSEQPNINPEELLSKATEEISFISLIQLATLPKIKDEFSEDLLRRLIQIRAKEVLEHTEKRLKNPKNESQKSPVLIKLLTDQKECLFELLNKIKFEE